MEVKILAPVFVKGKFWCSQWMGKQLLSLYIKTFVDGVEETVEACAIRILLVEGDHAFPTIVYSLADKTINIDVKNNNLLTRRKA